MADFKASISLDARNKISGTMRSLKGDLRGLRDSLQGLGRTTGLRDVARSFGDLRRNANLTRAAIGPLVSSIRSLNRLVISAGLIGSVYALGRAFTESVSSLDAISKASRKLNISPDKLRAFSHVAQLTGLSLDQVKGGLESAAISFAQIEKGTGRAVTQLGKFSPELLKALKGAKNAPEAVEMTLQAMNQAIERGDNETASVIAQAFFRDESWYSVGEMSAEQIAAGMKDALRLLGSLDPKDLLNVEGFADAVSDLQATAVGARDAITAKVAPQLTDLVKQLTEYLAPANRAALFKDLEGVGETFKSASGYVRAIREDMGVIAGYIRESTSAVRSWFGGTPRLPSTSTARPSQSDLPPNVDQYRDAPLAPGLMNDNLPKRAIGGPLAAGQTAIVGERGPELFRPNSAGHVYTASQTQAMLRQQGGGSGLGSAMRELTAQFRPLTEAVIDLRKVLTGEDVGTGTGTAAAGYSGAGRRGVGGAAAAQGKAFKGLFHPTSLLGGGTPLGPLPGGGSWKGGDPNGAAEVKGYLMQKHGFTNAQASGIVGNLIQESNLNPRAVGDGGTSFGIAQWHRDRAVRAKNWAASQGRNWNDRATQLDYMVHEMKTAERSAYNALLRSNTVEEATAAMIGFERPRGWSARNPAGGHGWRNRLNNAQRVSQMPTPNASPAYPGKLIGFEPTRQFARNLRPNMNRKSFEPAMRDRGAYAAAAVPTSEVKIGKGEIKVKLELPQGMTAGGVSVRQPENIVANVGVDRTGSFKPPSGLKTGTRSDLRQPRV